MIYILEVRAHPVVTLPWWSFNYCLLSHFSSMPSWVGSFFGYIFLVTHFSLRICIWFCAALLAELFYFHPCLEHSLHCLDYLSLGSFSRCSMEDIPVLQVYLQLRCIPTCWLYTKFLSYSILKEAPQEINKLKCTEGKKAHELI